MVYYITSVCHGAKHIIKVKLSNGTIWTKQKVVTTINGGNEVKTKAPNGRTAKVRTFKIKGVDYIRSVRDDTPIDNLGNLPKFDC